MTRQEPVVNSDDRMAIGAHPVDCAVGPDTTVAVRAMDPSVACRVQSPSRSVMFDMSASTSRALPSQSAIVMKGVTGFFAAPGFAVGDGVAGAGDVAVAVLEVVATTVGVAVTDSVADGDAGVDVTAGVGANVHPESRPSMPMVVSRPETLMTTDARERRRRIPNSPTRAG